MDVKQEFFRLKEWSMRSSGEEQARADAALDEFLSRLSDAEKQEVFGAIDEDLSKLHEKAAEAHRLSERINLRSQMESVLPLISVSALAKHYFGRSSSWFYQRLNGNLVHGKAAEFTDSELKILAEALGDLGQRLSALLSKLPNL